jgi:hypothetical protein
MSQEKPTENMNQAHEDSRLEFVRFAVDETPYACWEINLRNRNLDFLRGIDPRYFQYIADVNVAKIDDDDGGHLAALALRAGYSQALETMFALLGALVQAPECVYGWLLRYRNFELDSLVRKLAGRQRVLSRLTTEPTWENLSRIVHKSVETDEANRERIIQSYAKAWSRFARDFLDSHSTHEYNSIKHGLRTRLGGFSLSFGVESSPGQEVPSDQMKPLGGSKHGTSFYTVEALGSGRINFRARNIARNWVPLNMFNGLHLISFSIANILLYLRIRDGDKPELARIVFPDSPSAFEAPWAISLGVIHCSFDSDFAVDPCELRTADDVLASYGVAGDAARAR